MKRRNFLKTGLAGSLSATGALLASANAHASLQPTPSEIEGPFYPMQAQKDQDFDLTQFENGSGSASGIPIIVEGAVKGTNSQALEDVTVDLWQANAAGRYRHPHETNKAPLDPHFQGWAIVPSGANGTFRFKTIFPGAYPVAEGWTRPPHIHFKLTKRGYVELTTQMYFPDNELNAKDRLLQRKSKEEQELLIAKSVPGKLPTYRFTIILEKA